MNGVAAPVAYEQTASIDPKRCMDSTSFFFGSSLLHLHIELFELHRAERRKALVAFRIVSKLNERTAVTNEQLAKATNRVGLIRTLRTPPGPSSFSILLPLFEMKTYQGRH